MVVIEYENIFLAMSNFTQTFLGNMKGLTLFRFVVIFPYGGRISVIVFIYLVALALS